MEKKRQSESREDTFRKWVGFAAGQWWPNRKTMGEAIDKALGQYSHYSITPGNDPKGAAKTAQEGAEEFKRLTGYDAEDFLAFMDNLPIPPEEK